MDRQVESRTELQDPRVDATGGGSKRDDKGVGDQRARQRQRAQDSRELDPAHAVHDGDERVADPGEGLGGDDGMGQPPAQGDGGKLGASREPRGAPENMTKEALEAREDADRD